MASKLLTKRITADVAVTDVGIGGTLYGMILIGGTSASKLQLKDGTTSGGILAELTLKTQTAVGDDCKPFSIPEGIDFNSDIFADITGTNAVGYVFYKQNPN